MQSENLAQLFPELRDDERPLSAEMLDCYLELAWEILQELEEKDPTD